MEPGSSTFGPQFQFVKPNQQDGALYRLKKADSFEVPTFTAEFGSFWHAGEDPPLSRASVPDNGWEHCRMWFVALEPPFSMGEDVCECCMGGSQANNQVSFEGYRPVNERTCCKPRICRSPCHICMVAWATHVLSPDSPLSQLHLLEEAIQQQQNAWQWSGTSRLLQILKDAPRNRPSLWCSECAGWAKSATPPPRVEALEFPRLRQILRTEEQGGFASLSLVAPPPGA